MNSYNIDTLTANAEDCAFDRQCIIGAPKSLKPFTPRNFSDLGALITQTSHNNQEPKES